MFCVFVTVLDYNLMRFHQTIDISSSDLVTPTSASLCIEPSAALGRCYTTVAAYQHLKSVGNDAILTFIYKSSSYLVMHANSII